MNRNQQETNFWAEAHEAKEASKKVNAAKTWTDQAIEVIGLLLIVAGGWMLYNAFAYDGGLIGMWVKIKVAVICSPFLIGGGITLMAMINHKAKRLVGSKDA